MHSDSQISSPCLIKLHIFTYTHTHTHKSPNLLPSPEQLIQKHPIPEANPLFTKIIHLFCDVICLNNLPMNSFMTCAIGMRIFLISENAAVAATGSDKEHKDIIICRRQADAVSCTLLHIHLADPNELQRTRLRVVFDCDS
jgi:hypothetical protein